MPVSERQSLSASARALRWLAHAAGPARPQQGRRAGGQPAAAGRLLVAHLYLL